MQESARIAATIELLETIFTSRAPADALLGSYYRARRYIGAKDKGYISELVYFTLRHFAVLEWWIQRSGITLTPRALAITALTLYKRYTPAQLAALFVGGQHCPVPFNADEKKLAALVADKEILHPDMPAPVRFNVPTWLYPLLIESLPAPAEPELLTLAQEAPVDMRVNTLKAKSRETVIDMLRKEGFDAEPTPLSPIGIRLKKRAAIFSSKAFAAGMFEVQDEGSQIAAMMVDAKAGEKVIDFCAGAGGKTLAVAAAMKNKGRILAWDTSEKRLAQIKPRLKRAGVDNVTLHVLTSENDKFAKRHAETADWVLIDSPCTGTGTWRRSPDSKWRLTKQNLEELVAIQKRILQSASRLVKIGGKMVYATCSLLKTENEQQVAEFLAQNEHFRVVPLGKIWNNLFQQENKGGDTFLQLFPHRDGTDGFFAAILERVGTGTTSPATDPAEDQRST